MQRSIVIAGASGFIGSHVARALAAQGHRVVRLVRPSGRGHDGSECIEWDPARGHIDLDALGRSAPGAIVNLAGERLDRRWTASRRRRIRGSRVGPTLTLARAAASLTPHPDVLLTASAIGIYGAHRGDETLTERSAPGDDFLAGVAQDWEEAARPAADAGIRVVRLRTGIVLGRGGALARLLPFFRLGLGGRIGTGRQWMSWIAHDEWPGIVAHLLTHPELSGPVNLTAPAPVRNSEFTQTLARVLHRPAVLPVPGLALRLFYGEMARDTILSSQRVLPEALERSGYAFRFPDLEGALRHELAR